MLLKYSLRFVNYIHYILFKIFIIFCYAHIIYSSSYIQVIRALFSNIFLSIFNLIIINHILENGGVGIIKFLFLTQLKLFTN